MGTIKQKRVAKLIIENTKLDKPLNGGEMLAKVGYAKSMHRAKVNDVLESEGVKEELEAQGFTEENAKKVVQSIMLNEKTEPNARLKATDQVFKVHGSYAPDRSINLNLNSKSIDPTNPKLLQLIKEGSEILENESE